MRTGRSHMEKPGVEDDLDDQSGGVESISLYIINDDGFPSHTPITRNISL